MSRLERISNQAAALANLAETIEHMIVYQNHLQQKYADDCENIVTDNMGEITQEAEVIHQLANKAFDFASIYQEILEYISNYQF